MSALLFSAGVACGWVMVFQGLVNQGQSPVPIGWFITFFVALGIGLVVTVNIAEWHDICERKAKEGNLPSKTEARGD